MPAAAAGFGSGSAADHAACNPHQLPAPCLVLVGRRMAGFLALWMASVLWWTAFHCCVTASRQPMLSLQLAGLLYACLFLALLLHASAAQGAQGW